MLRMSSETDSKGLGDRIRERREDLGIRLADMARALGITRYALAKIESGETKNPKLRTLEDIALMLNTPIEELLGFKQGGGKHIAPEFVELARKLEPATQDERRAVIALALDYWSRIKEAKEIYSPSFKNRED